MPESSRRVDLRLTIPTAAPFRELAAELAGKFAEYAGASQRRAADVRSAVEHALAEARPDDSLDIEMRSDDGQLVISTAPPNHRTTLPLTD
jgi:hypothetical protein